MTRELHPETVAGMYRMSLRLHDLAAENGVTGTALTRANRGLSTRDRMFLGMWSLQRPTLVTLGGFAERLGVDPATARFYAGELEAICPAGIARSKS